MTFFINWLINHWNNQVDIVSFEEYKKVKEEYLDTISHEVNLTSLVKDGGTYSVRTNIIFLLLEKWLYRHANVYEPDIKRSYRDHFEARTALIYRYLYNKDTELFYDFDFNQNKQSNKINPIDQFLAFWLNLSTNAELAKRLIQKVDLSDHLLFVVFMGLRRLDLIEEANKIGSYIGYKVDDYNPSISTTNLPIVNYCGYEESLKLIKEAGFDTYDCSMMSPNEIFTSDNYLENAKSLRKYADGLGLKCNQSHSIFPVWHKTFNKDEVEIRTEYTKRILKISKILGAKNCIVHPINDFNEQENYAFFQQFLPIAREIDINIATENMWNWKDQNASLAACSNHDNFKALIDLVNDNHFCACVDIGHAEMFGLETSACKMIETLGIKVKCLHIHDNDLHCDRHGLPLTENIDFDLILDSLARIDYRGDITFEADYFIYRIPKELHLSCLRLMYQLGKYLRSELLIRRKAICLKR